MLIDAADSVGIRISVDFSLNIQRIKTRRKGQHIGDEDNEASARHILSDGEVYIEPS